MAIVKRKVTRPRIQEESRSNAVVNPDENKDSSSSSDAEEQEASQTRKQDVAKGKRPMQAKEGKKRKRDSDELKFGAKRAKGIEIKEANRSETKTSVVPRAKKGLFKRAYAVKSKYDLRTGLKGTGVNATATCEQTDPKGKGKETVTQDLLDLEIDLEEVCGRIKVQKTSKDDTDDNDGGGGGGGGGGGAHRNLSTLGLELAAAN